MIHVYTHDSCLQHDPGTSHPESPGRLHSIIDALSLPAIHAQLHWQQAQEATPEQVLLAHTREHYDTVVALAPAQGRRALDPDTVMSPASLQAALCAVGAACQGVDALLTGSAQEVFCLTRPPGHHATPDRAMGFCLFNQVAVAALHARHTHGLERVAVVDFDVHHGNGTQDCLEGKAGLLYVSTHQSPYYPGTGTMADNREGNLFNLPLGQGCDDARYRDLFTREVLPVLDAFAPQLVLVSAGFDAHRDDPLAGLRLETATYAWLGEQLRALARRHAEGRLLSVLEGGYNLSVLGSCVAAYLTGTS